MVGEWGGGGGGGRSAGVITREDNGLVGLQTVSSRSNRASSDCIVFVFCSVCNHRVIQLSVFNGNYTSH